MPTRILRGRSLLAALVSILAMRLAAQTHPPLRPEPMSGMFHDSRPVAEPIIQRTAQEIGGTALTLAEALRYFRERGFDLAIASETVAAADADIATASARPNPTMSLSRGGTLTYDPALCKGCSNTAIGAGITDQGALSDLATGKRRLRIAVARAARNAASGSRADVQRTLEYTLKQQLLQAELAKRSLDYAQETHTLALGTLSIVEKRYKAGAISEADVARADVQTLEAEQFVDSAAQSLAAAKAGLGFLLGFSEGSPAIDVSDDLLHVDAAQRPAAMDGETMLREALYRRPDLLLAGAQVARAGFSLDLARRLVWPDVLPSINYSAEGRGQNAIQPPTITFGVSATLPVLSRYRGEIARARADLRTQELTRGKIEAQIGSDVAAAIAAYQSASKRLARMDAHLLGRASRARDLVRLQYEKGAVSLFEYLDAQRTWLTTRTEYLQTISDYWNAVFQLEAATATEIHP